MPLHNFFQINLPYLIRKNSNGEWIALNREYKPLGWSSTDNYDEAFTADLPLHTNYKGLTEAILLKLAIHPEKGVKRDENGKIISVHLYNDSEFPLLDEKSWQAYSDRMKTLSQIQKGPSKK